MAYRIRNKDRSVEAAFKRIAREQIGKAIASIDEAPAAQAVHDVRKRCKKLRGLIRLVRPAFSAYGAANADFRDTANLLSGARDAKVMQDTYDLLMVHYGDKVDRRALGSVRRRITVRRKAQDGSGRAHENLARARERLAAADENVATWVLDAQDGEAVPGGLRKTYSRACDAAKVARENPSGEAFHELRKRIKYHWYHCRLLESAWPEMMAVRQQAAKELSDILGKHHDLDVFAATLLHDPLSYGRPADVETVAGLARTYQVRLELNAWPIAGRLLAQTPADFSSYVSALWSTWRNG